MFAINRVIKARICAVGAIGLVGALGAAGAWADPQVGVAVRAGTLGIGADVDVALSPHFNARVGYAEYSLNQTVNQTAVTYDGKLKLSNPSALIDWRPFAGAFRVSLGAVFSSTKIDALGTPTPGGTFTIGNNTYSSSQVGSLTGSFKFGNSVAPYFGIGLGNVVGHQGHWSFLFDLGAMYTGTPNVSLAATCTDPAICTQLQSDVEVEKQKLEKNLLKWWPAINFGVGYRF
jgi:hypothetical protein